MPILNTKLPLHPWADPRTARLPGIQPIADDSWITVCDAYAAQMAERDRLIAETPELVHALPVTAMPAALELYDRVLDKLHGMAGFVVDADSVQRPDGVRVALDCDQPLLTLGRLVQEDLCLMQRVGYEHALTAAVLCFPASWTLSEKLGRSMVGIHLPVESYTPDLARRVQRLFDAIRPEQPLWRMNFHIYENPALFHPRREGDPHPKARAGAYMRAERQCLLRLPQADAVLFSIHSYQVPLHSLAPSDLAILSDLGVMQKTN
ncbi:heme-dependent oxidative N-demethylase family protein [Cypionkella sinensis]|uniref:DUF3445 domain-containing protein n=1 Tax=Cypionkella sinensis TaxID=1756043 RepID=A0ABV7IW81_9RHOB